MPLAGILAVPHGEFRDYEVCLNSSRTTHLVTMEYLDSVQEDIIQILPHWFAQCLTLGKRIPERAFTFPEPELMRSMIAESSLTKSVIMSRKNVKNMQTKTVTPTDFLAGHTILIPDNLSLSSEDRGKLLDQLDSIGAIVTQSWSNSVQTVILETCDSDYIKSLDAPCVRIATVEWLRDVIEAKSFIDPGTRLLYHVFR